MKLDLLKLFPATILCTSIVLASTVRADVIFEDAFTGATGTPLNTREPDIINQTGASYQGSAAPRLMANRAVTVGNGCVSLPIPALKNGDVIRLSAEVRTSGENVFGYIGLGFTETAEGRLSHEGQLWTNIMNGGFARVWQGPAEPRGAGVPLYSDSAVVADTSGGSSQVEFSYDTATQKLVVGIDGYNIFDGSIDFESPEKLKYLVIQFNEVNTSSSGQESAAYIDNLTLSVDSGN